MPVLCCQNRTNQSDNGTAIFRPLNLGQVPVARVSSDWLR